MGTSSSFGGPGSGTPLVPDWLDDPIPSTPNDPNHPADPNDSDDLGDQPAPTCPTQPTPPQQAPPERFRIARSNFTKFVNSGGNDRRSLGRALSAYVSRGTGGGANAGRRMGSARRSTANLVRFLEDVRDRGLDVVLRELDLTSLAGRPIEEIFLGLMEYVCPEGGGVDEGIARDAFIDTIADLAEAGITDLNGLTAEQMQTVFELYASHAIEARIYNDVGTKAITLPSDLTAVERIQEQVHDFVQRAVADALNAVRETVVTLTPEKVLGLVGEVYESAFGILRALGEAEAR